MLALKKEFCIDRLPGESMGCTLNSGPDFGPQDFMFS